MVKYSFNKDYSIESKTLLLRRFELEDAKVVAELCNNYNIYNNTLSIPYPYTEQDGIDWIQYQLDNFDPNRELHLAIIDKDREILVGCVGIICSQVHKRCEIGYWIGEDYWNNSYATNAVLAMLSYVFNIMGYNKVYARHFAHNPSSGRVMKKSGMKYEGTLRQYYIKNGEYIDVVYYGILKEEYNQKRE